MANGLRRLNQRLFWMLPELFVHHIPSNRRFRLKWNNEVTGWLKYLETLEITGASDICMSQIQYLLHGISICFVRFPFSLIAKRILKKWQPISRDDMPNLRWLSTSMSLEYLSASQNHALCSSPDAMKLFYYQLDSNDISMDRYAELCRRIIILSME